LIDSWIEDDAALVALDDVGIEGVNHPAVSLYPGSNSS
jgi:hypothetical protein